MINIKTKEIKLRVSANAYTISMLSGGGELFCSYLLLSR